MKFVPPKTFLCRGLSTTAFHANRWPGNEKAFLFPCTCYTRFVDIPQSSFFINVHRAEFLSKLFGLAILLQLVHPAILYWKGLHRWWPSVSWLLAELMNSPVWFFLSCLPEIKNTLTNLEVDPCLPFCIPSSVKKDVIGSEWSHLC